MRGLCFNILKKASIPFIGTGISRFPVVDYAWRFVFNILRPRGIVVREVQGHEMYLDTRDEGIVAPILLQGSYERYLSHLLEERLAPGMIVADVGANIGYFSLIAAKKIGKAGKVYAFEPEPYNYEILLKNIELNDYENIFPIQKAVSDTEGRFPLYLDKSNFGKHSFSRENVAYSQERIEVETVRLDHFLETIVRDFRIDLLKIDVEGAEGLVIDGAKECLAKNNMLVIMEFAPANLERVGTDPKNLLRGLSDLGFLVQVIDEQNECLLSMSRSEILECFKARGYKERTRVNLLLEKSS